MAHHQHGHDSPPSYPSNLTQGKNIVALASIGSKRIIALNINQTTIHVHAGDGVVTKVYGARLSTAVATPTESPGDRIKRISKTVNERTWQLTRANVTGSFGDSALDEPTFEIHPEMVESPNFCEGEHSTSGAATKRSVTVDRLIELILGSRDQKCEDEVRFLAFVAPAGAGKSTCMRRCARKIMEINGISPESNFTPSEQSQFHVVIYLEAKDIHNKNTTNLADLLFGAYMYKKDDIEFAYAWLIKNQSRVVIFCDNLDQSTFSIEEYGHRNILPYDKTDTATIMYNLFARNLLPETPIVMSSREYKAASLPPEARPDRIVTLTGLSNENTAKIFTTMLGDNGAKAWQNLVMTSKRLLPLLSIPMFLVLTATIYSFCIAKGISPPKTVTGLFHIVVFKAIGFSEIIREGKQIRRIFLKLKSMAHEGMSYGLVAFQEKDLVNHGLTIQEVCDLLFAVPDKVVVSQCITESRLDLYFCHRSVQEFLSACYIAEMKLPDFQKFVKIHLHTDQWSVVRCFLVGIVFDFQLTSDELCKIKDIDKKQQILRESLTSQFKSSEGKQQLELLTALYESDNDSLIKSVVQKIQLTYIPLDLHGSHLVSSVMSRCNGLQLVQLARCGLNDEKLGIMSANLQGQQVHIRELELHGNPSSTAGLNCFLESPVVDILTIGSGVSVNRNLNLGKLNEVKVISEHQHQACTMFINQTKTNSMQIFHSKAFSGTFNKKENTIRLEFEESCSSEHLRHASLAVPLICGSSYADVTVDVKGKIPQRLFYMSDITMLNDWLNLANLNATGQMTRILVLDRDITKLDPSLITMFVQKFQVKVLDIPIKYDDDEKAVNFKGKICQANCEVNIHYCATVHNVAELKGVVSVLSSNAAKYLRLHLFFKVKVSDKDLEHLVSFIKNGRWKKLTFAWLRKNDFKASDIKKMKKAIPPGIELEFCVLGDTKRHVWSVVDDHFTSKCHSYNDITYEDESSEEEVERSSADLELDQDTETDNGADQGAALPTGTTDLQLGNQAEGHLTASPDCLHSLDGFSDEEILAKISHQMSEMKVDLQSPVSSSSRPQITLVIQQLHVDRVEKLQDQRRVVGNTVVMGRGVSNSNIYGTHVSKVCNTFQSEQEHSNQ